jgi:hypothetical protein
MTSALPLLPVACAASAALWAAAAARRAGPHAAERAARALLGGVAAFSLAWGGYALLDFVGLRITWELVERGGTPALLAGVGIGAVEEGAKLAGLLLGMRATWTKRNFASAAVGVAAGFAALECATALAGVGATPALAARVLLAPAAHAILLLPAAMTAAWAARAGGAAWLALVPALGASALLHGAGDLSLAADGLGRAGYAAALLAPVLALYAVEALRRAPAAPAR